MRFHQSCKSSAFAVSLIFFIQGMLVAPSLFGQATCNTPTNIFGFGVDGDVRANTPAAILGDSWFYSGVNPGSGIGVIGTSAATATPPLSSAQFGSIIQAAGSGSGRNRTYQQRMSVPALTNINGNVLIDAFAARDNVSPDSTAFLGSNKNGDNPTLWSVGYSMVPSKNDIIDVAGHLRRNVASGKLWLYAFITKLSTSGSAYADIEIYRSVPYIHPTTGNFTNTGPAATGGHTTFTFTSNAAIQSPGDIILCMNYSSSGGVASIKIWCNINNLDGNGNGYTWFNTQPGRPFNFTGDFITGSGGNGYGYAEIVSLSGAPCLMFSVLNSANTPAGDWGNMTGSGATYDTNIEPEQLVNIAFNFTDIGLDFASLIGPCHNMFGALWYKTRSSASYSSELKDCCGPYTLANFTEIQANAGPDRSLNCTASQITLNGSSAPSTALVSWTTPNGNIVSGANTTTPVVNMPGTYIMSAQSSSTSSCIAMDTVIVSIDILAPNVSAGSDKVLTCAATSQTLNGTSTTPGATFSWTTSGGGNIVSGSNSSNAVVNAVGCYFLVVTNPANGCVARDTACVTLNNSVPIISGVTQTNVSCFAACNGAVSFSTSAGQSPFTYLWSNGATSQSVSGLCAGIYTVTVTGANGCTASSSFNLSQPSATLTSSATVTQNVSCNGGSNGAITGSASGGTTPYFYLWSNGATTASVTGLMAGSYTITVTDANGCTSQSTAGVVQPSNALASTIIVTQNVSCNGGSNGAIDLTPSGGTTPYTYLWNNGTTTQDLTNVISGTYTVTVSDANGCTTMGSGTITQPAASLSLSTSMTQPVACFGGSTGSAGSTVSGGTSPYNYNWSNGATTPSITSLPAGTYTITVTDANGCLASGTVTVTQPSAALATTITSTQSVSCFGGNNGSIDLNVTGGTAPYGYNWSNGASTQDITNLLAGTYTVTVTDVRGCTTVRNVTITQPAAALSASASANQNVSCFGGNNGAVNLVIAGGTSPYSYSWSNGASSQNLSGLNSGTYTVTVTDVNGCVANSSATVIQPSAALSSTLSVSQTVSCFGGNDGSLSLITSNGTSPYSYLWNTGATTQNLSNLSVGTYTVTVTDANGCTNIRSATVSQPVAALAPTISIDQNVSCFGGSNGSIDLSVNGGTAPYSYIWSNTATTQDLSNLTVGTYTVTVTDNRGCTATGQATISQPVAALSASVSSTNPVSCFGGNNGSVNLNVSGGTAPYTYNWSNGATSQNLSGLNVGTYTVTVTDVNGCVTNLSQAISQPSAALTTSSNVPQQVSCFGGNNGSVNLTVSGGTAPYSYSWSNGSTSQNLTGLSAGNYTVNVTDINGCTAVRTITITQPVAALSANANQSQAVSCYSENDGQISLLVSGGTSPYTYNWSNGATTQAINGLISGTYTVTVTDANGCTGMSSATITQPSAALSGSTTTTSNISCFSGSNGSIDLTVIGGTGPYTYMWNTGVTTEDLSGLPAGNYSVTITDVNGCTATSSGVISQPAGSLSANLNVSQNVACFGGGNGALDLTVSGGTTPYTFSWSNGATTEDISGLAIGTYTVSITDVNGCISSATGSITQPSAALSANVGSIQNVSCFGGNTGSLNLVVSGGTVPYSFNWSNGATSQNINNLSAGTYTVTVTDINGCSFTQSGMVSQPAAALSASVASSMNVNCFGGNNGSVNLTVNGGIAPYIYTWSNGATTQNISGLSEGTYSVNVVDINGCNATVSVTISEPAAPLNLSIQSLQSINCFGGNNGEINVSVSGGTSPYTYQWNTGATTSNLTGLTTGTYTLTVTDINGCVDIISTTLSQPLAPLSASLLSTQNVACFSGNDGEINISLNGGTYPYTILWSNGSTDQNISNLAAGNYTASISDANGCTTTLSATISQPSAQLSTSTNVTAHILCFGGSNGTIDLSVSGGTAPYIYQWSNGATSEDLSGITAGQYSVTITDTNGCTSSATATVTEPSAELNSVVMSTQNVNCFGGNNGEIILDVNGGTLPYSFVWSNGQTSQNLNGLASGMYTVSITDANGCTAGNTITISQPQSALDASIASSVNVSCNGGDNGNIDLNVIGGTSPYTFLWNNGSTNEDLSNLSAGMYIVTVTDANGCISGDSILIDQPASPLHPVITSTTNINCFADETGAIDLTVSGGTPPYTYSWSNGSTNEDLIDLPAGTYVVEVTDANGCIEITSITLTQPSAPLLGLATVTSNVFCNGGSNGAIDVTINGGTQPYSFLWSNGQTTEDINNLSTGIYTVTITDANGCTTEVSAGIGQPSQQLNALVNTQDVLCFNGNNGMIDLTPSGGTVPYSFVWSNGATTEDIAGLIHGIYTVTISDANGCDTTITATIIQPVDPLIPVLTVTNNVSCYGGNNGSISLSASGGTPPYVYLWSTGESTTVISNLPAGQYTLTVTDANGCNAIISDFVSQPAAPLVALINVNQNVSCHSGSNGELSVNAAGGTAPYVYFWSNGATTSVISGLTSGTYTVTVTDANGCTYLESGTISQPSAPLSMTGSTTIANCLYGIGGNITINVLGGTQPYSYLWSNGTTNQNILNGAPGIYMVTVTDANGCTLNDNFTIENSSQLYLQTGPTIICVGDFTTMFVDSIPGAVYQWYFGGNPLIGATSNTFMTPAGGYYYVSVSTACGTFSTDSVEVIVKTVENATITSNQIICPPEMVQLQATGGVIYQWTPATFISSTQAPDPIVAPQSFTTYTVEITNEWGCTTTLSVDIAVACDTLLVPNGFSPNNDGVNDGYVIDHIENYPGNRLWVYNRWGNLVYKARDYDNSWDGTANISGIYMGKKVPTGTYFFILDLNDKSKPRAGYLIIRR